MNLRLQTTPSLVAVLLAVGAAALSSARGNEKQIAELKAEIAALNESIAGFGDRGATIAKLVENVSKAEEEIAASKEAIAARERAISDKEYLLGIYQNSFRVVSSLTPGENLGAFQLKSGENVDACSFVSTAKNGILVQSATGSRTIPLDQLPDTFASRIQLPPAIAAPSLTTAALLETKPDILKTEEDLAAAKSKPAETVAAAPQAADTPPAPAAGGAVSEAEAVRMRNAERMKQIQELKFQFSKLSAQKKTARAEKASSEKQFRMARIKKSQTEVDRTMDLHNMKISGIEAQEAEIREKIARLQSALE